MKETEESINAEDGEEMSKNWIDTFIAYSVKKFKNKLKQPIWRLFISGVFSTTLAIYVIQSGLVPAYKNDVWWTLSLTLNCLVAGGVIVACLILLIGLGSIISEKSN